LAAACQYISEPITASCENLPALWLTQLQVHPYSTRCDCLSFRAGPYS
jgi:hypothetical protein